MVAPDHFEDHLAQARRHLAIGVRRVADQRVRVERLRLRFCGEPVVQANELLQVLERTLTLMFQHRDLLEVEIEMAARLRSRSSNGTPSSVR
jgi:hypothetical protein